MAKPIKTVLVKITPELFEKFTLAIATYNSNEDVPLDKSKVIRQAIAEFIRNTQKKY